MTAAQARPAHLVYTNPCWQVAQVWEMFGGGPRAVEKCQLVTSHPLETQHRRSSCAIVGLVRNTFFSSIHYPVTLQQIPSFA